MTEVLAKYLRFCWAGLVKYAQTGALIPSQRFLVDRMIAPIPLEYQGRVIELGAGNGALTLRLAANRPRARVLACEINSMLARDNRENLVRIGLDDRVRVVTDSAQHLLSNLIRAEKHNTDFIISGIPLAYLGKDEAFELIQAVYDALTPGGMYIQFQHSLLDRGKIQEIFKKVHTRPVFLNVPPAFVYYAQR
jgi:phospholipid N-methyltransferase